MVFLKPYIFKYFVKKWSSDHHLKLCKNPNCSKIINIDGNWKTARLKCMHEDFFFKSPEFNPIKIGCIKTPQRLSYFCEEHSGNFFTNITI